MKYKWWILVAILLFGIGIIAGLATPATISSLFSDKLVGVEELSGILAPFKVSTVILIFIKNVIVLLFSFALSPIFCLVPILTLAVNGWLLALVSSVVVEEKSLGFVLAGLLPHGIIELPALFIGEAAALSFGVAAMVALFKKERRELLLPSLRQNLKYLWIALALLLPAAIIETYITPLLAA
jgi:stage II sporulation protein M